MPTPLPGEPHPETGQRLLTQIGIDAHGNPLFKYADTTPVHQPAPIQQRPWGAYIAAAVLACTLGTLFLIGLAIVATVLTACVVCLTICVVILKRIVDDTFRQKEE